MGCECSTNADEKGNEIVNVDRMTSAKKEPQRVSDLSVEPTFKASPVASARVTVDSTSSGEVLLCGKYGQAIHPLHLNEIFPI